MRFSYSYLRVSYQQLNIISKQHMASWDSKMSYMWGSAKTGVWSLQRRASLMEWLTTAFSELLSCRSRPFALFFRVETSVLEYVWQRTLSGKGTVYALPKAGVSVQCWGLPSFKRKFPLRSSLTGLLLRELLRLKWSFVNHHNFWSRCLLITYEFLRFLNSDSIWAPTRCQALCSCVYTCYSLTAL